MFLSPVFPPLFSLHRHIFHDERKCKESSLDVKAHDVLLQLNSSRSPSFSQILKKDFYLVSDRSVGYNSTCYTVRPEILFFLRPGLYLILLVNIIIKEALVRRMLFHPKKSLGSAVYFVLT